MFFESLFFASSRSTLTEIWTFVGLEPPVVITVFPSFTARLTAFSIFSGLPLLILYVLSDDDHHVHAIRARAVVDD